MNNKKTVFIIGAGASKEANIPTGHELKQNIYNLLNFKSSNTHQPNSGTFEINNAINLYVRNLETNRNEPEPYRLAAKHICDAMSQAISIDNFINDHKDKKEIAFCGKLAIIRSILEAEKVCLLSLNKNGNLNYKNLENTWYDYFMKLLIEKGTKENISEYLKSVVLIIFNYDRCVEHFLYHSFKNYLDLSLTGQESSLTR